MDFALYAAAHFLAGMLIGARFRFAALLPAFAVVLAESLVVASRYELGPWYVLLATGIVAVQAGYAMVAYLIPPRRVARRNAHASGISAPDDQSKKARNRAASTGTRPIDW